MQINVDSLIVLNAYHCNLNFSNPSNNMSLAYASGNAIDVEELAIIGPHVQLHSNTKHIMGMNING